MLVSHCYINKEYVVFLYGYSRFLSDHHYKTEILLRDILNTILILLFNLRCIVSCSNVQLVPLPSFSTFTNLTLSLIPRSDDSVQLLHSPSSQSLLTVVSWNEKINIPLKCSHEKPFKVCRYFTWFCTNRQYAYFYKLSEITLKRITIDKKDKSTYKRHENIGQYIKHKFLFPIVCFSASINDFHLNISAGGLLLKLGPISLTHRYPILPILFKPV